MDHFIEVVKNNPSNYEDEKTKERQSYCVRKQRG